MLFRSLLLVGILAGAGLTGFAQTAPMATPPATATVVVAASLDDYAGTYAFESGSPLGTYTVTVKDGSLYGDAGMGNYKLVKQPAADQFQSTSSYGSIITFSRDKMTNAITGLTLAAQGQELSATKSK